MKPTDLNSFNEVRVDSFTDDFLLLVLKNLKFRKREIEEEIILVEDELERRGLE